MKNIERTIKSDKLYQGKIINLRIDTVELPDQKYSKREIVEHPGAVAVIPITEDNKIVMVKQYRKSVEEYLLEVPAGKLEIGEEPLDCAKRELLEETGYKSDNLQYIFKFYTSPGFCNETISIFLAKDLIVDVAQPDEDEYIEIEKYDIDELIEKINKEEIKDAKTIISILYIKNYLK
ncbi:NUDIX hydrolase [Paramaledivibacter caminithermalis]|jgi:ADP-ribose pyrophosphatase|uniref:ADP-ribose pyrophosphatase n=1 Tax=Paramaledivibacter caminithermalis (strain DSM 15212 / CIP 107654 / DViRD3) TaxID=1121301 RepID=A0A1M6JPE9_PARC5|nr:NUDIX hydrolase [Paramaledivibacter caminithermalis]SHJ48506.1 ADP-ribose pyrophosphatase [Paramaledivibacter caminithermalis DSM 15212]